MKRILRAVLEPVIVLAAFALWLFSVVVFAPYYALLWIGNKTGIIDTRVKRQIAVAEIVHDAAFDSFDVDLTLPHDDRPAATRDLSAIVTAVAGGAALHFYRSPANSEDVFGPFTTLPRDIDSRIGAFVSSIDYGTSADCWFVSGTVTEETPFDLSALREGWNAELVEAVLIDIEMLCIIETIVDQGSHNSRVIVCGRGDRIREARQRVDATIAP